MTISNSFLVRIVADTELGRTAAATTAGSFSAAMSVPSLATPIARLDPFNPDGTDYPDCSGGTTTNGYSMTRAWIWASKAMFDTTTRRVLFVNSPHPFDAFGSPNGNYNGYISLLTSYDEADNDIHVYESPFSYNNATWPRTVGHAFDNQCLVDRTLYKMTTPLWISGTGWVQPQVAKIDIDQVTDSVASAREGEAYLGSINAPWEWDESALTWQNPGRNLTAGALDYLPGSTSLVFFHKKWLSFCPISTGTWTQPIDLNAQGYGFAGTYVAELGRTTWPIHNVGHYNPTSGKFICGGGAYNPDGASNHRYQLDWISVDATTQAITKLDDSPVIMSVSETDMPVTEPAAYQVAKVAACAGPNSVESLFFHDNGNVYGLNPFRPPGYQWRVVTTLAFEVDLCVPIDDYGVVLLFTSGANGTASMRVYKPPVAGDHTPPSVPLDVAATATSSSEITVTWSASTDPVIQGDTTSGVAGYRVYRNGTLVTPGPVGLVTTFGDSGLTANTAYSYTVSAYDAAGNESDVSIADSATTDAEAETSYSPSTWGGVILTQAQHESVIPGTNNPHFERTWYGSGGWNGEGYMRWRIAYTQGEDDDGYDITHPDTATRGVYLSWMQRVGASWWNYTIGQHKFVMFYPVAGTNPRPTIFVQNVSAVDSGPRQYMTIGPDLEAGGAGYDEFARHYNYWYQGYPNHQYKEGSAGMGWRFMVAALLTDRTRVWMWSSAGAVVGSAAAAQGETWYAESPVASSAILSSWNAQSWRRARLLAYIKGTTAGDANAYMDIGRIRLTQTLPSPPAGFVTG